MQFIRLIFITLFMFFYLQIGKSYDINKIVKQ